MKRIKLYILLAFIAISILMLLIFNPRKGTESLTNSSFVESSEPESLDSSSETEELSKEPITTPSTSISDNSSTSSEDLEYSDSSSEPESEETLPLPLVPTSEQYTLLDTRNISDLKAELKLCEDRLLLVKQAIEAALNLGYDKENELIKALYVDYSNYETYIDYYERKIKEADDVRYPMGTSDYPVATFIWNYLKAQGWSDFVCAGIMGNIMQETGGRSFNIDYLHDSAYYGMCCWRKEYHPDVVGLGLEAQCAYLVKTLETAMNTYGKLYETGYTFQDFLEADSIEEAATAFMVVYERPGGKYSVKRVENGQKAFDYFA